MKISHPPKRLYLLLISCLLISCSVEDHKHNDDKQDSLAQTRFSPFLTFGTVYSRNTFFYGPRGPEGFEYELIKGFSKYVGIDIEIQPFSDYSTVQNLLKKGKLDIAATGQAAPFADIIFSTPLESFGPIYRLTDGISEQSKLSEHDSETLVPIRWQFADGRDDLLQSLMFEYLSVIRENGLLSQLEDKYFNHVQRQHFVDTETFINDVKSKLEFVKATIKAASSNTDWRLLAAMSHQTSNWHLDTNFTEDANYFSHLIRRIPARIPSPDRIWMALAAYHMGLGHLEDARILTQNQGGNPDIWLDVETRIQQLQQKSYYSLTRYGYVNGSETVDYVKNIRRYYDTLIWLEESMPR